MEFDCVVTDLDGTLLNSNHEISIGNLNAILSLKKAGIPLIFATARHPMFAMAFIHDVAMFLPACCGNGAVIYNFSNGFWRSLHTICHDDVETLLDFFKWHGVFVAIHDRHGVYFDINDVKRKAIFDQYNRRVSTNLRYPYFSLTEKPPKWEDVFKFSIFSDTQSGLIESIPLPPRLIVNKSEASITDIVGKGAVKGKTTSIILNELGISPSRTLAFGDSENDISMAEDLGFFVAMENATQAVKKAANFITKTNNEDGFAFGIKTLIDSKKILPR